jgi:hypothetical protein
VYSTIAQQKVSEAMTKSEAARILGHERDLTRRRDVTGIKFASHGRGGARGQNNWKSDSIESVVVSRVCLFIIVAAARHLLRG